MRALLISISLYSHQAAPASSLDAAQGVALTGDALKKLILGITFAWPQNGSRPAFKLMFMENGKMLAVGEYTVRGSYRVFQKKVCYRLSEYEQCYEVYRVSSKIYKLAQTDGRKINHTIVTANK